MFETIEKISVERLRNNGVWMLLRILVKSKIKPYLLGEWSLINVDKRRSENEAVEILIRKFERTFQHNFSSKILQGFRFLREEGLNTWNVDVYNRSEEYHLSCEMNFNEKLNSQPFAENEVVQSEISEKLADLDENSETLKFFEDKTCSVCLNNYKEVLDEHLHIVVPTCGHPLCCKCADGVLNSQKKECPQCRAKVTIGSFNLMKFNSKLEVKTQDQRVFL